jgi:hypothetical protein
VSNTSAVSYRVVDEHALRAVSEVLDLSPNEERVLADADMLRAHGRTPLIVSNGRRLWVMDHRKLGA